MKEVIKPFLKSVRQIVLNGVIFFGLIGLTFWFIFKDQDLNSVFDIISKAFLPFVILGLFFMAMYLTVEALNLKRLLNSLGENVSFKQAFKYVCICFFFSSVTPSATGGQPLEVYYMSKDGISTAHATLCVLLMTAGIEFAVVVLGIFGGLFAQEQIHGPMFILYTYGVIINTITFLFLTVCIFWTGGVKNILGTIFTFLYNRGLKKAKVWEEKTMSGLDKYNDSSKYIKTHMKEFGITMLRGVVQMSCLYLVPFAVMMALGIRGHNIFEVYVLQATLFVSTSGIPLPGAIGASESAFLSLYTVIFPAEILSSAMLLNRGISFYLIVLFTMAVVLINVIVTKRKEHKLKEQSEAKE